MLGVLIGIVIGARRPGAVGAPIRGAAALRSEADGRLLLESGGFILAE
jgi:hypothetical protein